MTDADETREGLPIGRWASRRAEYLAQTTVLPTPAAEAVAYSELGYSDAGISKQVDAAEGTVTAYLDRAVAHYGPAARHPRRDGTIETDLKAVDLERVASWPQHRREVWRDAVDRHPDYKPPALADADDRAAETVATDGGRQA
jgi:hypothetical protein